MPICGKEAGPHSLRCQARGRLFWLRPTILVRTKDKISGQSVLQQAAATGCILATDQSRIRANFNLLPLRALHFKCGHASCQFALSCRGHWLSTLWFPVLHPLGIQTSGQCIKLSGCPRPGSVETKPAKYGGGLDRDPEEKIALPIT